MYGRFPFALLLTTLLVVPAFAGPDPSKFWNVDDVMPGMKGHGLTVVKGTKVERFEVEVLGVLKNTSPGRDLVLCRLGGLDLKHTGVIAGMSGSPVYIDDKLVGAVAYAWPYGKDPIAGITPFSQMHRFVESFERREVDKSITPARIGLKNPLKIDGKQFDTVSVSQVAANSSGQDSLWLMPLRTPLATSGFTANSLKLLEEHFPQSGLVPMQGGATPANLKEVARSTPLEIGGAMTVALITGDFDMSGIGTVTHIEGKRVYGWGHPLMSLGECELPLMTGYVHTVYPRQTVSFKMGSPLRTVGVVNADVSTCIAGWLDRKAEMIPMHITVRREPGGATSEFKIEVVRQRQLLPSLVFAALANAIDQEGEFPEEMTAVFTARIEIEGHDPVVIRDVFAGVGIGGSRAAGAIYMPMSLYVNQILGLQFQPLQIKRIDCETEIHPGRRAADIEGVELDRDDYAPGDTVKASVFVRPFKGSPQRLTVSLPLPADLPEGSYQATIGDEVTAARADLRARPELSNPLTAEAMLNALRLVLRSKRTTLAMRLALPPSGVSFDGKTLADLPAGVVQLMGQTRRTPVQTVSKAITGTQPTIWVLQGAEAVRVHVRRQKKTNVE